MLKSSTIGVMLLVSYSLMAQADGQDLMNDTSLKVIASSDRELLVEFVPQGWRMDSLQIDGDWYQKISCQGTGFSGQEGQPLIPVKVAVIGIPVTAQLRYTVIEAPFQELSPIKLLPHPRLVLEEGLAIEKYIPDAEIYQSRNVFPPAIVELEPPGYFRQQRIVRVKIYPVQYIPEDGILRRYDKVVVKIEFTDGESDIRQGGKDAPQPALIEKEEEFYREVVLNYQSARNWRKKPQAQLQSEIPTMSEKILKLSSAGDWYKIVIRKEGLYKIAGSTLAAAGIDISAIDPETIRLYNNGGRELPRGLNTPRPDSLIENAILMVDGGDGKFDASDYFLFYGKPVEGWDYNPATGQFSHYINHYTYDNIYWLTWGETKTGKRMAEKASLSGSDRDVYTSSTERVFLEQELNNLFSSGLDWYGPHFSRATAIRTFTINLPGAIPSDRAFFKFRFVGATQGSHRFYVYVNDNLLASWYFSDMTEKEFSITKYGAIKEGFNTIELQYQVSSDIMLAYLDWIEVEYIRRLQAQNGLLFFNAPFSPRPARYEISGFSPNQVEIFDISDFSNVKLITDISSSDNQISFVDSSATTTPKRYLAVNPSIYETPKSIVKSKKDDLRNPDREADFIIMTHEDFYDQAVRLQRHRQDRDNLKTMVVNISDIYDEFSWGLFDPTAIRDFLNYAFFNYRVTPSYVLLFGDGDYDYKNLTGTTDKNWIPPYETTEFNSTNTRATDDWYTFVNGTDQFMDLAIGRLPVRSIEEARTVVDKIIAYETNPLYGDWKNTITIVGDDELGQGGTGNETFHIIDSEDLVEYYVPKEFDIKKIYLTEYPAVKSASISGVRKPAAAEALLEQLNRGTVIVNFIGHGNEKVLTHEHIFTLSESLGKLQNDRKWPFWVAATCAFGRYDIPQEQSLSEILLTTADRGVIALLASSREAFADPNAELNKIFYRKLFYQKGETRRLGQALMFAKLLTNYFINDQKYHILGDPTLRLAIPQYRVIIDSVEPRTIQALGTIKVRGRVEGQVRPELGGKIFLKAFDSKKRKTYRTDLVSSMSYLLPGNAIFRGTSPLQNGAFEIQFIVPKDITYGGNLGRLSVYFWDDTSDGAGYQDSLQVGGTITGIVDVTGPEIKIGIKGQNFISGDLTGPNPILVVEISDSTSSINITGEIGHTITLTLDNDRENKINLTDYFNFDEGNCLRGSLEYQLTNLAEGEHLIEIKAWDNFNNSSTASAVLVVRPEDKLILRNVLNYPNPFSTETTFTLEVNHHDVLLTIKIYTVAGRLIRTLNDLLPAQYGFNTYPWDGKDEDGESLANGVYLYKVTARCQYEGQELKAEEVGRLVVMR